MDEQIIRITRALNHPIRIQILYYLNDNQKSSVNNLVKQFDVSQPAISRHLRILEEAKLVKSERVRQERYYSLEDKHVIKILDVLRQHVKEEF
ncbi:ArsR/SmtB family transcription factor [Lactobacillus crispatus]|nr:metalloregulator ArsR/SmtB family transcription factor [Lactobacillus crispatus]AZR16696.1 ArsR family transcriptional regulator [Lactobacillus crispatus]EEU19154.1 transcriptional regulator, ArsR family [Lactobacillus crispatus 125-2-CHN]EEX29944.1 transcriptional regulator, ArsR family [Lactobacillus crispatus MV-3A-US]EFD98404.1 transcriptional regulator, ArsR family [Lactobacillus crispatus 214-1]KAA8782218.1 winged helix-turn-helix transcriptional regulator [Lactobacillus crispatus]